MSSCLEVHVAHAAVVLLLDFVNEVSAWGKAEDASCVHPRSESDRCEARRRGDRYAQLYPAPSPDTQKEPGSMLALGGAEAYYLVTLEDVFIALPDHNPAQQCIKRERGWAFCVGVGGDVAIDGKRLALEDGGSGDVTAALEVRSSAGEESVTLHGTLRMLTCLMDTVPDGEINLTPAGGHHFMLEPTPIRLKYEARLDLSHRHAGARPSAWCAWCAEHGCAEAHHPHVHRKVELHINAQATEGESEVASDSSAAQGSLGLEEEMEMLDTGLQEEGDDSGQKDFNATAFDMQVLFAGIAGLSSGKGAAAAPAAPAAPPPPLAAKGARAASRRAKGSLTAERASPEWMQETHVDVVLKRLSLACHGEIFAEDRPMLQLNLRRAMVHVQRKQLLHEATADGAKPSAAYVPQQAAKMRGHAALSLDAHYLNMNINELEPLVEPWQMSGHAVKPLGLRITSGRLYSTRLLQLNLSMALQRTLNHITSVQQKHRLSSADRSDHHAGPGDDKEYTVQDQASNPSPYPYP